MRRRVEMIDSTAVWSVGARTAEPAKDAGRNPGRWPGQARGRRPAKAVRAIRSRGVLESLIYAEDVAQRRTVHELLEEARMRIDRRTPEQAVASGAQII